MAGQKFIVTADGLNVRKSGSIQAAIIGSLDKGDVVKRLDSSDDDRWLRIQADALTGWASHKYLMPQGGEVDQPIAPLDTILHIAETSELVRYEWLNRGLAPRGYIKGMALVYGRVYSKWKAGDAAALEMAKANTGDRDADALAWYSKAFNDAEMDNDASGGDTLRHLFVLLIGLGMRESSGRYCEGLDRSADNGTATRAEAGMFQTSYNARTAHPTMPQLFQAYSANPDSGFLTTFQEGVHPTAKDLETFGSGDGAAFQRLSKSCPAFAVEFAAVGLRNIRTHWGPINTRKAEILPACNAMLHKVETAVDAGNLGPLLV